MLSERLKSLRKEHNLTQIQFAKVFSIANGTVAMWETNKRIPDINTLQKIADYYGVTVDYLLGRDEEKPAAEDELDREILERFSKLTPAEADKVSAFIAGLLASRE